MTVSKRNIPAELAALPQWVCWGKPGQPLKCPHDPRTGYPAKAGAPETWCTLDTALKAVGDGKYTGVGFEFAGGLVGVDFDHCIHDGKLDEQVAEWVKRFDSYTEISPSGTGLHIICKGSLPGKGIHHQFAEMYDSGRYFTITGQPYGQALPVKEAQDTINALYGVLRPEPKALPDRPTQPAAVPLDDVQLIEKIRQSARGREFAALWAGDISGYKSHSEADIALCNMLAWWTNGDAARVDGLFRCSGLMREKWDRNTGDSTYGAITVNAAVTTLQGGYSPPQVVDQPRTKKQKEEPAKRLRAVSAKELQKMDIPPMHFVVTELLPHGMSLLVSPPKYGKSWFVLDLCLSVAAGRDFLGHKTNKGACLYLALEDSNRRLKYRMQKVLGVAAAPDGFDFVTDCSTLDDGLLEELDTYLKEKPGTELIVIDTLEKVRGQQNGRESAYKADYRELGALKKFADEKGICILLVHHLRKMGDDGDPFNRISGTNGILGAADTAMVMTRKNRNDEATLFSVVGRDIDGGDTMIAFDKSTYRWHSLGSVDIIERERARQEYQSNPIVVTIKKLMEENNDHWSGTMSDLLEAGQRIAGVFLAPTARALSTEVKKLEPLLFEYDRITHGRAKHGNAGYCHHFYGGIDGENSLANITETPFGPFTTDPQPFVQQRMNT